LFSGYKAKKNLIAWILGLFVFVIFPFIWLDTQTVLESFNHFRTVTFGRGIPISPHNQSFYAFSMRMLSGEAFQAPALQHTLSAYPAHLPVEYARGLSIFWSLLFLGAAAVSLFRIKNPILFFSFCLLASPFLWKSDTLYFLPLVLQLSSRPFFKRWLVILFCILQLLSLDIIGRQAVTLVESSSLLMWFFAMISWKELFRGAKLSR